MEFTKSGETIIIEKVDLLRLKDFAFVMVVQPENVIFTEEALKAIRCHKISDSNLFFLQKVKDNIPSLKEIL